MIFILFTLFSIKCAALFVLGVIVITEKGDDHKTRIICIGLFVLLSVDVYSAIEVVKLIN